jgi:hypothetical protein
VSLPPLIRRTHGPYFREVIPSVSQLRSLDTLTLQRLAVWEGRRIARVMVPLSALAYVARCALVCVYGDRRRLIAWLACSPARNNETAAPSGKP